MRILITNIHLENRAGTEMVVRDLAIGLSNRGQAVDVYSPALGPVAEEMSAAGTRVVSNLTDLGHVPDIVHGHHTTPTLQALMHFPDVPGIYVCHDRTALCDTPPLFPRLHRYVAVDLNCRERIVESGVAPGKIEVIHNAVDLEAFRPRGALPPQARRALMFSNYMQEGSELEAIRQACVAKGLTLDVAGQGAGNVAVNPGMLLGSYDIVFGKARCALEALAVGCAVIVCDRVGLGGMVTSETLDGMRDWNFGARLLSRPITFETITRELSRYNAGDAAKVSERVRKIGGLDLTLDRWLATYESAIADHSQMAGRSGQDERRLFRKYSLMTAPRIDFRDRVRGIPVIGPALVAIKRAVLYPWQRNAR